MNFFIVLFGKILSSLSKKLNLGSGSTWPGHIALKLNRHFIEELLSESKTKVILITGTNGKTTTSKLIETILTKAGKKVILNKSGANLLNGLASLLIENSNKGKIDADFLIFEADENVVPKIAEIISPDYVIALDLFRDQLDRYGEIDSISRNWKKAYEEFTKSKFILNADDPQIYFLSNGLKNKTLFFGLNEGEEQKQLEHASDSTICPKCGSDLKYSKIYYSHIGNWSCPKCGLKPEKIDLKTSPLYPLKGTYNQYNTLAAVLLAKDLGINDKDIEKSLKSFVPAFGRQEILKVNGKRVEILLAKNPSSFNESLRTIESQNGRNVLIVLNDRIPDGTDVSWIWDVDFKDLTNNMKLSIAGDRVYDLALRMKYADKEYEMFEDLEIAIKKNLEEINENQTLFILPTYSAMLDARKLLTGRKIL